MASTLMGFDFGEKRIGVALGNTLTNHARPLVIVAAEGAARRFAAIEALIAEWQPDALVVGVPYATDGSAHDMTVRCQRFARQLHGRFRLPVHRVDERYSSVAAGVDRPEHRLDAEAAAIILQQYFDEHLNS